MRINDLEKMQQNLQRMKNNLEEIERVKPVNKSYNKKGRRAVEKKINKIVHPNVARFAREEQIIVIATIAIVAITFIFSTSIFAKTISENIVDKQEIVEENKTKEENIEIKEEKGNENKQKSEEYIVPESNENAIKLEEILMENVSVLKSKEYAEEVRAIPFEKEYHENAKLPEGEEVITQEGIDGTKQVTVIKSYENNVLVSENILEEVPIQNYIPQKIDKGTSKFLSEKKVHIGDIMYVTEEIALKEKPDESSNNIYIILKSLEVRLNDLVNENWCKVNHDGLEGYVQCRFLTSSIVTPEIVEANRIQRIKMTLNEDIALNKSTNLTLDDYKRILTGNMADRNNVIAENAEVFYNMDKKYNMNGVFLASIAIHESGWATSNISRDKRNLFGYGAYDRSPYQSSFSFETYAEGIELVAKALVKYYINQEGTPIFDGEVAKGSYYNGPTVAGVNIRYASDTNWHNKVYSYMQLLYNRL